MKSNYIIAHCVYTLIKSVDAITLLVIHHSTEITIAVNFTFIFSDLPWRARLSACLLWQVDEVVRPYKVHSIPQLLSQLEACEGGTTMPPLWYPVVRHAPPEGYQCCPQMGSKPTGLNCPWKCPLSPLIVDPWAPVVLDVWNQISSNASTPPALWCAGGG